MRREKLVLIAGAWLLAGSVATGCATDAAVIDEPEDETDASTSAPTDSSTKDATGNRDSATTDSAKADAEPRDASSDATTTDAADAAIPGPRPGDPFDPTAPKTGDPCPAGVQIADVIERRCGKCGVSRTLCEAGRIVGTYGACSGEKTAATACLPGERLVNPCGYCGSQVVFCDNTCAYTTGLCQNEVANGCTANEVNYVEGVCAVATDVRKQVCSATCVKQAAEPCAPRPVDEITVSLTAGTTVTGNFSTTGTQKLPLLTSTACPATESSTISSLYHWTRLKNPGADSVTVTVANGVPPGASRPAVTFAGYAGANLPTDRKACSLPPYTTSPEKVTLTIPAGGAYLLHTMLDTASATQAKLALEVTTNFVGAEPAPAPQYTVAMSQTTSGVVNQAITFDATKLLARPNIPSPDPGTCPLVLSSTLTNYSYVRVDNAGATARIATVETTGGVDLMLAYYAGPAPVSTTRTACTGQWADEKGATFGDAKLTGVTIPAGGFITVYVGKYSTTTGGTGNLRITTTN